MYLYEFFVLHIIQFELVRPTSIQSMLVGGATMMLISFLFIPNVLCSLWVAFSIVSIELGVVGYMALWNVNLDSISMVNLIMCIGFSVDFTAHICYAYMSSKAVRPKDRVQESLYALGLPIIQGAISTILGVSALILAGSYIFMVFFKMIFLVIVFGALHGMFLLPVLLSLFGPGACGGSASPSSSSASSSLSSTGKGPRRRHLSADKSLPHPYYIPHPSLVHPADLGGGRPGKPYAYRPGDKDLGLGTSEESSESSSSKSQRKLRREAAEDEAQRRKYMDGWRKATSNAVPASRAGYSNNGYFSDDDRKRGYASESYGGRPLTTTTTMTTATTRPNYYDDRSDYQDERPYRQHDDRPYRPNNEQRPYRQNDERPYRSDGRYHH